VSGIDDSLADLDLPERLLLAMKRAGFTQVDLARRLHSDPRVLRRYLSGERTPPREVIAAWERECAVAPGALSAPAATSQAAEEDPPEPAAEPSGPKAERRRWPRWRWQAGWAIGLVVPVIGSALWWATIRGGRAGPSATAVIKPARTTVPVAPYVLTPLATADSQPSGITAGPDGNLWFTEQAGDSIWRFPPRGNPTRVLSLKPGSHPFDITTGPDGNVWFTEGEADGTSADAVGKIDRYGHLLHVTALPFGSEPTGIAAGPDGNLWVAAYGTNQVFRINPDGRIDGGPFPVAGNPNRIAVGPDNNLWITEANGSKVAVLSTAGTLLMEYQVVDGPTDIVTGPDNNIWITAYNSGSIQRINPATAEVSRPFPVGNGPGGLAVGPDRNLWFTELSGHALGVITPAGVPLKTIPIDGGTPFEITEGPDSNMWFTVQGDTPTHPDAIGHAPAHR
jgi:streptogramin lyase/transcriptional regulator with XRE-family HTH domain